MKIKSMLTQVAVGAVAVFAGGVLLYYANRVGVPLAAEAHKGFDG